MMNANKIIVWSALFGALAVVIGALGAHALEKILDERSLNSIETAVRYQFYHALLLMMFGLLQHSGKISLPAYIHQLFIAGILCFSFSIYVLILLKYHQINYPSAIGLITPLGGILLIAGWIALALMFLKLKNTPA